MNNNCEQKCDNDPCDHYCPTQTEYCAWDKIYKSKVQEMIDASAPDMKVIDALTYGITDYECGDDVVYSCGDVIVFKGSFYQSKINENDRHPHDDNAWKALGTLKDIFNTISTMQNSSVLKVEYHNSCSDSPHCQSFYNEGDCVAIKVDTGDVDGCGNAIFVDEYYSSTSDANVEVPSPESVDWNGPFSACDLFKTFCEQLQSLPTGTDMAGG